MNENITKLLFHIDNNTGQIIKAEQEDASTGERTEVTGNFDAITVKQADPTDNVGYRIGEPAPDDDDDDVASASGTSTSAPKV